MGSTSWFHKFLYKPVVAERIEATIHPICTTTSAATSAANLLPPLGHILALHQPSNPPAANLTTPTRTVSWRPGIPVTNHDITHQERDLFRAKSFTLLSQSNLPYPITQWIALLQETPIVKVASEAGEPIGRVTLQQMLPLVACRILVEVSFQRQGNLRIPSVPLKESFHLSVHPNSAHPLPRQHTGWAMGEGLFTPSAALVAQKMQFLEKTQDPLLLKQAKQELLFDKQRAFQQMPKQLLERHLMLAYALESAAQSVCPMNGIHAYFATLNEKEAWDHLTHLYETVNFLVTKEKPPLQFPANPLSGEPSAILAFQRFQSEHPAECYTKWLVQILRQGHENPDSSFGKKLQILYELQLEAFLSREHAISSLTSDAEIAKWMMETLDKEIAILNG